MISISEQKIFHLLVDFPTRSSLGLLQVFHANCTWSPRKLFDGVQLIPFKTNPSQNFFFLLDHDSSLSLSLSLFRSEVTLGRGQDLTIKLASVCVSVCVCRAKQLIRDAILENDFLKNLDATQVREIVDCMYEKSVRKGHFIIKEGEPGQHVYVAAGQYTTPSLPHPTSLPKQRMATPAVQCA